MSIESIVFFLPLPFEAYILYRYISILILPMIIPSEHIGRLVNAIHKSPLRLCMVITGAGVKSIGWLLSEPGSSSTILEVQVPYSRLALEEFIGSPHTEGVSISQARLLAELSYKRTRQFLPTGIDEEMVPAALSCTGALSTNRERKGEDRVHIGLATGSRTRIISLTFAKDIRVRYDEEVITSMLILNTLADAARVSDKLTLPLMPAEKIIESD